MDTFEEIEKYQLVVALLAAKYQSLKSEEICRSSGVNKMLKTLLHEKFESKSFQQLKVDYETRVMPDSSYEPMIDAFVVLLKGSFVGESFEERKETLLEMTYPYAPDDEQLSRLIAKATKISEAPHPAV